MIKLPDDIRQSTILDSGDLNLLRQIRKLPDETVVNDYKLLVLTDVFMTYDGRAEELETKLHQLAKEKLMNNKVEEAWKILLAFND